MSTVEGIGGSNRPRLAIPLLVLAKVYSRSGRVTLAEGLYRGVVTGRRVDVRDFWGGAGGAPDQRSRERRSVKRHAESSC